MNTIKFNKGNVRVVAHRGLSGIECENTNAAFVAAGNRSYYGIETDVHRTADGRFVILHNSTTLEMSGDKIPVEETTLATLESIVLFDKDGTKNRNDLRLPTLENYISICKKYEKHCVLELKSDFTDAEILKMINIIKSYDYLDSVTFISFIYDNLTKIRSIVPEQSVQYLFSTVTDELIEKLKAAKIDIDANQACLTAEIVEKFHAAGLKVNCWTVDTPERGEALAKMGVDFITSNILE